MTNLVKSIKGVLLALVITGISIAGCDKEELLQATGMVVYYGDFASGGCGWVIEIGAEAFETQNLPDALLVDSLPVDITYKVLQNAPDCRNRTDVNGIIYVHKVETIN